MTTIHHQLLIDAPVSRVYEAIATAEGISKWWDKQTARKAASSPASVWTGTRFIFELRDRGDNTTDVDFSQTGYDETSRHFDANREAWHKVLQNLKRVIESHRS